ncbi:hypothetical protein ACFL2T_04270 [Elusimicrobiota bacterium]
MRLSAIVSALVLLAALSGPDVDAGKKRDPSGGKESSGRAAASKDTVAMVEFFIKADTASLPPEIVPEFMEVDPKTLPRRLQDKCRAKQAEFSALQRVAAGKMKPPLRRLGVKEEAKCDMREESAYYVKTLKSMGFAEITSDEEGYLMEKTKCTECELQEEFSLMIVLVPSKKKKELPTRHLLLQGTDPLWALVGRYRQGKTGNTTGTAFFGIGMHPACR